MAGIFAVESDWFDPLDDKSSVRGVVELLAGVRGVKHVHKVAGNREILLRYLDQWAGHRYRGYDTGYLAFHGNPGSLWAGEDEVTFDELAEVLAGRCDDRRLHLSGCNIGSVDVERLRDLRRVTGAQVITAYTTEVEWIEGAALDLVLLDWLVGGGASPASIRNAMKGRFKTLAEHLGLVVVSRQDVLMMAA